MTTKNGLQNCRQAGLVAHKSEKGGEKDLMMRSGFTISKSWVEGL